MPAGRVQWKANVDQADPATAVFDTTPVFGNLLVAIVSQRSGTSHTAYTIDGSGWTKTLGFDSNLSNTTFRCSTAIYYKIAGASEPTSISIDNGTSNAKRILIQEFQTGDSRTFGSLLAGTVNGNPAVTGDTSLSTGVTASTSGEQLLIGLSYVKRGATTATYTTSWTNGLANNIDVLAPSTQSQDFSSALFESSATGTKESTFTITDAVDNRGLIGSILAFELVTGGGGGTTGQIKVWNGSSHVPKPVKAWNGTSWVTKPLKRWNGTSWITTPY